jgi:hypothetical protein
MQDVLFGLFLYSFKIFSLNSMFSVKAANAKKSNNADDMVLKEEKLRRFHLFVIRIFFLKKQYLI